MAKEKVIEAYRALESRLHWLERLEQLRANHITPLAIETLDLGEFDKTAQDEILQGQVYAPFSPCGGVIRIVWYSANGRDSYVIVKGFEDFLSECLRRDDSKFNSLGERILAERLNIQVNERRPRPLENTYVTESEDPMMQARIGRREAAQEMNDGAGSDV